MLHSDAWTCRMLGGPYGDLDKSHSSLPLTGVQREEVICLAEVCKLMPTALKSHTRCESHPPHSLPILFFHFHYQEGYGEIGICNLCASIFNL